MSAPSTITLFVNGRKIVLNEKTIDPRYTLLQFLRRSGLTGAKLGCGEGGCGACTVMLSSYDAENGRPVHYSANACLTPVCALDGIAVTTVEGIGNMKDGLHPVQQRISAMHGSQCGFCTPGIVMAIYTHLRANPNATPHEIESSLDGNLCRCTGYRPILDAARSLSNNKGNSDQPKGGCCRGNGGEGGCPCAETLKAAETPIDTYKYSTSEDVILANPGLQEALHSRALSEPIFPPELTRYKRQSLSFEHDGARWYQPVELDELLAIKASHPEAKLIVGNTEVGIEMRLKAMEYTTFVNPTYVPELRVARVADSGIEIGAAVTINGFRTFIEKVESQMGAAGAAYRVRGLTAIRHMLTWFASNHIRNVACVGGNIATASPISDLNPMLLACNAVLRISSKSRGPREMSIRQFFLGYRKVALEADEVLVSVLIPFTEKFEYVLPFKQARRREDDVSIVTAGLRVVLEPNGTEEWTVRDCSLAFGGMAPTTILAPGTAAALVGKPWSYASVEGVFPTMRGELSLPVTVPGGQSEFRTALTVSFLFKAFLTMTAEHGKFVADLGEASSLPPVPPVNPSDMSATFNFLTHEKTYSRGEQGFFDRQGTCLHKPYTNENKHTFPPALSADTTTPEGGVGQSITHRNSAAQVTGITKYVDDMPLPANAVHACLVTATRAHARLLSVDTTEAEKFPGFVAYFSAKDVVGSNHMGAIVHDEEVFVTEEVLHYGAVSSMALSVLISMTVDLT
jgi:xanthine dehydrogenase/oxidase